MEKSGVDVLVCALPMNVLMLTGYCPVAGVSIAVADRKGEFVLVVPSDEKHLAGLSWADEIVPFETASLDRLVTIPDAVCGPLQTAVRSFTVNSGIVGIESGDYSQPAPYVGMHAYRGALERMVAQAVPQATVRPVDDVLAGLRAVKTRAEVEHIRAACALAGESFREIRQNLKPGLTEKQAAVLGGAALSLCAGDDRCEGCVFCMSGPNGAKAYAAYQMSTSRQLAKGDLALVHLNSHINGYWTDVTRTYSIGEPDDRQKAMYLAVAEARAAALEAIKPGARAADVDRAARAVMEHRGFGKEFRHPTGHSVGFVAIDHNAPPRLHPASPDVLATGMVFNVEPGIYIEDYGGMRHCDVVAVTETGYEVLTPFQLDIDELTLAA